MYKGIHTTKVAGGKLFRVKTQFDKGKIQLVQLTGDFFLHPEEMIETLEESFIGLPSDAESSVYTDRVSQIISEHDIDIIGMRPEDIGETLAAALSSGVKVA